MSLVLLIVVFCTGCKVGRFFMYNFADIKDYKKFPAREIEKGSTSFHFYTTNNGRVPRAVTYKEESVPFESFLERTKTVAFLIIKNDTIQYENYFSGYDESSIIPSFSMAKSFTSMLIGCAIDDGFIGSENDLVVKYIPELADNGFADVTIKHVLQMTSGLKFNEGYVNPFGEVASFYYGRRLRKATLKLETEQAPGESFDYKSGNTEILGLILDRVLKDKTVTQYFQEKIWLPLEMEYDASWSIDKKKDGIEKTFCCVNARAKDFAKLGRLYLNDGNWNGRQIVSPEWVKRSTMVDESNGSAWYYQYQWWLPSRSGDYMAQGLLGQFVYVNPAKHLIVVRLGKKKGDADWWSVFTGLAAGY